MRTVDETSGAGQAAPDDNGDEMQLLFKVYRAVRAACTAAEGCKELRSADGDVRRGRARRDRKRGSDCKQEDVSADSH